MIRGDYLSDLHSSILSLEQAFKSPTFNDIEEAILQKQTVNKTLSECLIRHHSFQKELISAISQEAKSLKRLILGKSDQSPTKSSQFTEFSESLTTILQKMASDNTAFLSVQQAKSSLDIQTDRLLLRPSKATDQMFAGVFADFECEFDQLVQRILPKISSQEADSLLSKTSLVRDQAQYLKAIYAKAGASASISPKQIQDIDLRGRVETLARELDLTNSLMLTQQGIIRRRTDELCRMQTRVGEQQQVILNLTRQMETGSSSDQDYHLASPQQIKLGQAKSLFRDTVESIEADLVSKLEAIGHRMDLTARRVSEICVQPRPTLIPHLQGLLEECDSIRDKHARIKRAVLAKNSELEAYKEQISKLNYSIEASLLTKLDDQSKLQHQIENLILINAQLRRKLTENEEYFRDYQEVIAQLEQQRSDPSQTQVLKLELSRVLEQRAKDEMSIAGYKQLVDQSIVEKQELIERLQQELDQKSKPLEDRDKILLSFAELKRTNNSQTAELQELRFKIDALGKEKALLEKYVQEMEQLISSVDHQKSSEQQKWSQASHQAEDELRTLKASHSEISATCEEQTRLAETQSQEIARLQAHIDKITSDFQSTIQEYEKRAAKPLRAPQDQIAEHAKIRESYENSLKRAAETHQSEIRRLSQQVESERHSSTKTLEIKALSQRQEELKRTLAQKDKLIAGYLASLRAKDVEITQLTSELQDLTGRLLKGRERFQILEKEIEGALDGDFEDVQFSVTNSLTAKLQNLDVKIKEVARQNSSLTAEKKQFNSKIESLHSQLQTLQSVKGEYDQWKEQNSKIHQERDFFRERADILEYESQQHEISNSMLKAHIEQKEKDHQEELAAFTQYNPRRITELSHEAAALKEELAEKTAQITDQSVKINEYKQILGSKRAGAVSNSQKTPKEQKNPMARLVAEYEQILSACSAEFKVKDASLLLEAIQTYKRERDRIASELQEYADSFQEIRKTLGLRYEGHSYVCKTIRIMKQNENLSLQTAIKEFHSLFAQQLAGLSESALQKIGRCQDRLARVGDKIVVNPRVVHRSGVNPLEQKQRVIDRLEKQLQESQRFEQKVRQKLGVSEDSSIFMRIESLTGANFLRVGNKSPAPTVTVSSSSRSYI